MKKILVVAGIIFIAIFLRVAYLQIYRGDEYAEWSRKITLRNHPILAPRGVIKDRDGKLLADNQPIFEVYVERDAVKNKTSEQRKKWADLLDVPFDVLETQWQASLKEPGYRPIILKTGLTWEQLLSLKEAELADHLSATTNAQGLELRYRPVRVYGTGERTAEAQDTRHLSHLLGYVRGVAETDLKKNKTLIPEDEMGVSGVERAYDTLLRGKNGREWLWVNARGKQVDDKDNPEFAPYRSPPTPGTTTLLSIHEPLQRLAYRAFGEKRGSLVAIHIPDGEILSLVSVPGFDANLFTGGISSKTWKALSENPTHPLINRAVQGIYPPGSIYKIVTATAALEQHLITQDTQVNCPGYFMFGSHRFGCWNKRGHGSVNLRQALEASCDVFFYTIGLSLDVDPLAKISEKFGFNSKTALQFPYESSGFIPTRLGLQKRYKQAWSKGYMFPVMIGQGSNAVTPLQAALMMARFANNDQNITPTLLHDANRKPHTPTPILSPEDHAKVESGLRDVVSGASGTGHAVKSVPVRVAGKTGTAQAGGRHEDHAWFVAYAPLEKPTLAVAVLVENGGHGGGVAAPIAAQYLTAYFEMYPHEKNPR